MEDENYITLIKGSLPGILEKYHEVESYQLVWELIKTEFRSETINYSKTKRKGINKRETVLQGKLVELDNRICQGNGDLNQPLLDEYVYDATKKELKEIYNNKAREAMFRSKARWIEKGEKPTNYFFNLEKRNFEKKVIAQLKIENGEIITVMKEINKELESFYSDLLGTKFSNSYPPTAFDKNFNEFIQNLEIPKLSPKESTPVESERSIDEVKIVLNSFQNNKSPGDDGFSKEF